MSDLFSTALAVTDVLKREADPGAVFRAVFETEFEETGDNDLLPGRVNPGLLFVYTRGPEAHVRCDVTGLKLARAQAPSELSPRIEELIDFWSNTMHTEHERDIREITIPCVWRRTPQAYIDQGIYRLYSEQDEYPERYPEQERLIELLSAAADRYRYSACLRIVNDPSDENARAIWHSLMNLRYSPADSLFTALEMLWLYCMLFKPTDLPPLADLLRHAYSVETKRNRFNPVKSESYLLEFYYKYNDMLRLVVHRRDYLHPVLPEDDPLNNLIRRVTRQITAI